MTYEEENALIESVTTSDGLCVDDLVSATEAWQSACERADGVTEQLRVVHDRMVRFERAMIDAVKTLDIL